MLERDLILLERDVGRAMAPVAAELRLLDPLDLISMVQGERSDLLADMVESAAELSFKPGTLRYGDCAHVELDWEVNPVVVLNLELIHRSLTVFVQLKLTAETASVGIDHVLYPPGTVSEGKLTAVRAILEDARLTSS